MAYEDGPPMDFTCIAAAEDGVNQSNLMTFLKFKNITDEEIRLSTSFLRDVAPEAGRSVELGIRYSF